MGENEQFILIGRTAHLKMTFYSVFMKRCVIIPYTFRQPTLNYSEERRGEIKQIKKKHRQYEHM